jgi:hypothetical protein
VAKQPFNPVPDEKERERVNPKPLQVALIELEDEG